MRWPRIVAESLRELRCLEPPTSAGPVRAAVDAIEAAVRAAQAPERCAAVPPAFLRPHQHDSWRRVMRALEGWGGALLLEPVGTGKTWIGLGVAACEQRPAVVIVPAILQSQWHDAAHRAGLTIHLWTHERASRGRAPDHVPALVIIDEAHRLRDPATRRAQTIAPWLVGKRTLLITATPVVNRPADLVSLLRLVLPEDALMLDGIARLGDLEADHHRPALRRVAIRSPGMATVTARRSLVRIAPDLHENERAAVAVAAVRGLQLSHCPAIRRLLSSVLYDAAASSDAAFHQALKRYRALLLQGREAGGASRALLRRFAGEALDQLVLWPLLSIDGGRTELPLDDVPRVELLLTRRVDDDRWISTLADQCRDERPAIWFTRHRATARQLRHTLGEGTAWVTGSEAGIGPHRVPRAAVLSAFGADRRQWRIRHRVPLILVATDVAAEGLDLHAAGRIVHVDLPWTAMRLEQREGRLARIGQQHANVEVMVRIPAAAIEQAWAPEVRVRRKRRLADGLLQLLEADDGDHGAPSADAMAITVADDGEPIDLVAVGLCRDRRTGMMIMLRRAGEGWSINDALARSVLQRARAAGSGPVDSAGRGHQAAAAAGAAVAAAVLSEPAASLDLINRIHRLARQAAAARDGTGMQQLDRLLRFATASPTHGARILLARLAEMSDGDFMRADVPDVPLPGAIHASVIAMVACCRTRSPM